MTLRTVIILVGNLLGAEGEFNTTVNNDSDDTGLLLPSEVDIKMAPKLLRLQFPRVDEGNTA